MAKDNISSAKEYFKVKQFIINSVQNHVVGYLGDDDEEEEDIADDVAAAIAVAITIAVTVADTFTFAGTVRYDCVSFPFGNFNHNFNTS